MFSIIDYIFLHSIKWRKICLDIVPLEINEYNVPSTLDIIADFNMALKIAVFLVFQKL